jgi:hypothetical protein
MSRPERTEFSETPLRVPPIVWRFWDAAADQRSSLMIVCGAGWTRRRWESACDMLRDRSPPLSRVVRSWDMDLPLMIRQSQEFKSRGHKVLFVCSNDLRPIERLERSSHPRREWRRILFEIAACLSIPIQDTQTCSSIVQAISPHVANDGSLSLGSVQTTHDIEHHIQCCTHSPHIILTTPLSSLLHLATAAAHHLRVAVGPSKTSRLLADHALSPSSPLLIPCALLSRGEEQSIIELRLSGSAVFVPDSDSLDCRWQRLGCSLPVLRLPPSPSSRLSDSLISDFRLLTRNTQCSLETPTHQPIDDIILIKRTILIERLLRLRHV